VPAIPNFPLKNYFLCLMRFNSIHSSIKSKEGDEFFPSRLQRVRKKKGSLEEKIEININTDWLHHVNGN
jgi:hypothetical protein